MKTQAKSSSLVNRSLLRLPLLILPLALMIGVAFWATKGIHDLDNYSGPASHSLSSKRGDCVDGLMAKAGAGGVIATAEIQACNEKAISSSSLDDLIKTRIDELKWILTVIGSMGAFFVIAQGAASFFSALAYTNQAEKTLREIKEIEKEIQSRYPVFRAIEEQRSLALLDLAEEVKIVSRADNPKADPTEVLDYNYKDTLYGDMKVKDRQRLLSLESFASIDLHPGPLGNEKYSDSLKRFAMFYQSKFQYEKNAGFGSFADLERAESYLRLACENSRGDFTLLNDLGVICLDIRKVIRRAPNAKLIQGTDYVKAAEDAFSRSLMIEPMQQRVYYNIAVLKANHAEPRDYKGACAALEKALEQKHWQRAMASTGTQVFIFYNLGCYYARVLAEDEKAVLTVDDAKKCLKALHSAANLGGIKIDLIENDFRKRDGDFAGAYAKSNTALKLEFNEAERLLRESASRSVAPRTASVWEAAKEGLKSYRASRRKP